MVEAGMGLAADFDVAQRPEEALVVGEHDAHAQPDPGQASRVGIGLDGSDETPRQPKAAGFGHDREPAEIQVAFHDPGHDAAQHRAVPLRDDRARAFGQLGRDSILGFAERSRLGDELAAILREGRCDRRRDRGRIAWCRWPQDKRVAHRFLLA